MPVIAGKGVLEANACQCCPNGNSSCLHGIQNPWGLVASHIADMAVTSSVVAFAVLCTLVAARPEYRLRLPNPRADVFAQSGLSCKQIGHVGCVAGYRYVNRFGRDFAAAGYRWTKEFCELDSDDDGVSNGAELGDPCCDFANGGRPARSTDLSYPGEFMSVPRNPQNRVCNRVARAIPPGVSKPRVVAVPKPRVAKRCGIKKWHPCNEHSTCCGGFVCKGWQWGRRCEPRCANKWHPCNAKSLCCAGWKCTKWLWGHRCEPPTCIPKWYPCKYVKKNCCGGWQCSKWIWGFRCQPSSFLRL